MAESTDHRRDGHGNKKSDLRHRASERGVSLLKDTRGAARCSSLCARGAAVAQPNGGEPHLTCHHSGSDVLDMSWLHEELAAKARAQVEDAVEFTMPETNRPSEEALAVAG